MNPHRQSTTRLRATARAPPPLPESCPPFPASEKNSQLHRRFKLIASPNSAPLTLEPFLNPA